MNFENFFDFIEIIKNLPKPNEVDELCKSNLNFFYLDYLSSLEYFKLLTPIQIYHLFSTACAYESIDIAMLLYKNNIDMIGVKELMINFMAEVGSDSEYVLFRWIWEKNNIVFTNNEINECLIKILKTGNIEFIEWFLSIPDIIKWNNLNLKKQIANEILETASYKKDFIIAKYICKKYSENT